MIFLPNAPEDVKQIRTSHINGHKTSACQYPDCKDNLTQESARSISIVIASSLTKEKSETLSYILMALEAWFVQKDEEDQRLPHHKNPPEYVSMDHLASLGVLYWKLDPKKYEDDPELDKIRQERGYSFMDLLDLCPEKVENYDQKLKNFYTEHIHADEEIRYCLEGSGYFDVRDKSDKWIRVWIKPGDLIVLPAGIYHRFTLDTGDYIKLMRLFVGEPVWTPFNRPQEDHPARRKYVTNIIQNIVAPLEAY